MSRMGSDKRSFENSEEVANSNKDTSTSSPKTDASANVKQECGDNSKPSNDRTSNNHDIRNKKDKSSSSSEEDESSSSSEEEPNEILSTTHSSDLDNVEDWIDHKDSDDLLTSIEATQSEAEQDVHDSFTRNEIKSAQMDRLLKSIQERFTALKREHLEQTRWLEFFDARLAKYRYMRAVKACEKGLYESASEWAELAREERPRNERLKELKRKITTLRIGVLEEEIKELRKAWWKDRE